MDVRCERCSTEYELDDDSVPDAGCPVQCTTCGHTFMVTRRAVVGAPPPSSETLPSPPAADWLMETTDGRLHRFRNLTSLQKWIIERKVTREDKISRTGQSWRRLGEIVELAPFFDVVDEADRARAGQAGSDELKAEAQRARNIGTGGSARDMPVTRESPVPPRAAQGSPGPAFARNSPSASSASQSASHFRRPTPEQELAAIDAWADKHGGASGFETDHETSVMPRPRRPFRFLVALMLAGLASAAAVLLYQRQVERAAVHTPAVTQDVEPAGVAKPEPAPAEAATAESMMAKLAPADEISAAIPPAGPTNDPQPGAAIPAANSPGAPSPAAPAPTPIANVAPVPAAARSGTAANVVAASPPAASADSGTGYDRALSDADRLLENGATEKAFKLYEKARKMRPDGAEALAGLGYVMLDKDRPGSAVGYFEKALAQAPNYGPAVFGMGEALRANGQDSRALEMYRRYLRVNSTGVDAPAARRQAAALEDRVEKSDQAAKTKAPAEGNPPGSPTAAPTSPAPSASSVLNEPATP